MIFSETIMAALNGWSGREMQWGRDDCALAVADIYVAAGLPDPARAFRGRYRSRRGALRVLGRPGLEGAVADVAAAEGWPEVEAERAPVGALGLVRTDEGPACVIKRAKGMWVGRLDRGFGVSPDVAVFRAWKVI